jgi:methionyl-tRNA formyltransferase
MRIVFMGSPEFALPALRGLIEHRHDVIAVYTQPDRPVGRGQRLTPPPVKKIALEHDLRVVQPQSISALAAVDELRALAPDLGVVAAYGQILRERVLDVFRLGILNVHASLLPRWRGAAPVTAAILAGDAETGASIMKIVRALDAGPVLARARVPIEPSDTTGTLTERIAEAGAALLTRALPEWEAGTLQAQPQDDSLATYAPQVRKDDALIDFGTDSAAMIARKVRAYHPWPIAHAMLDAAPLRIIAGLALDGAAAAAPGTIVPVDHAWPDADDAGFGVATVDGVYAVLRVQPPGGRVMLATDYLRGHREITGRRLTGR